MAENPHEPGSIPSASSGRPRRSTVTATWVVATIAVLCTLCAVNLVIMLIAIGDAFEGDFGVLGVIVGALAFLMILLGGPFGFFFFSAGETAFIIYLATLLVRAAQEKSAEKQDADPYNRARYQFGLKSIFALMLCVAVSCSLIASGFWYLIPVMVVYVPVFFLPSILMVWRGFRKRDGNMAAFGVFGLLLFVLYPASVLAWQTSVWLEPPRTYGSNLERIWVALKDYDSAHKALPPVCVLDDAGKPKHSWRVLLLPYLEHHDFYKQYCLDEPWDGPNNRRLQQTVVDVYTSPARDPSGKSTMTRYVAVVGPGTVWSADRPFSLRDIPWPESTVLLLEVANSSIHWMEPHDLELAKMPMAALSILCKHPTRGSYVLFANGSIKELGKDFTFEGLRSMVLVGPENNVEYERSPSR